MRQTTWLALAVIMSTNCSPRAANPDAAETQTSVVSETTPATAERDSFVNPVIPTDFPDPGIFRASDANYYCYATQTAGLHIQAAHSTDLIHWTQPVEVLPEGPPWSPNDVFWAPQVDRLADGNYLMYYSARQANGLMAVAAAMATSPLGPFTPALDGPLVAQNHIGGDIDPAPFVDADGTRYIVFKNDGNCCGFRTYIWLQQTQSDGLTLVGNPAKLITADQTWEHNLVEAPFLWRQGNAYVLFYSAANYANNTYATGYARADALVGPYTKPDGPILATDTATHLLGPGGANAINDSASQTWLVYHGWAIGAPQRRVMNLSLVTWTANTPAISGAYDANQSVPQM